MPRHLQLHHLDVPTASTDRLPNGRKTMAKVATRSLTTGFMLYKLMDIVSDWTLSTTVQNSSRSLPAACHAVSH